MGCLAAYKKYVNNVYVRNFLRQMSLPYVVK